MSTGSSTRSPSANKPVRPHAPSTEADDHSRVAAAHRAMRRWRNLILQWHRLSTRLLHRGLRSLDSRTAFSVLCLVSLLFAREARAQTPPTPAPASTSGYTDPSTPGYAPARSRAAARGGATARLVRASSAALRSAANGFRAARSSLHRCACRSGDRRSHCRNASPGHALLVELRGRALASGLCGERSHAGHVDRRAAARQRRSCLSISRSRRWSREHPNIASPLSRR